MTMVWSVACLAFVCEYIDSSLGMGYGTMLVPILLIMGYSPLQVVPAVLISEFLTGFVAAGLHHGMGNVDFREKRTLKVSLVLGGMSVLGVVIATVLAIHLPATVVKTYIAILVTVMGLLVITQIRRKLSFSWPRLMGIGALAAFNKGISGGGYGPLVTGGQIVSGVGAKAAIGITSLAESLTCLVGLIVFLSFDKVSTLTPSLIIGAMLSVPFAAYTVKRLPEKTLTKTLGVVLLAIGTWSLIRVIM